MVYVLMGAAYVVGVFVLAGGVLLLMLGGFPRWWQRMSWPVVNGTRRVARIQGIGLVTLGLSVIAIVFTNEVSQAVGGGLVLAAIAAYVLGLALFLLSTWVSRRPAA